MTLTETSQAATNTAPGTPIQGVTLYSFTRQFHARQFTFDQLIREVAKRGLGPGLEIVGFQSIRSFPNVDQEFVKTFRALIDETGLLPSALGANADAWLQREAPQANDALVEYMRKQLEVAHELGFPVVRVQYSVTPDDMERLLPLAEKYDVKLGMEVHSHHSVHHPVIQALLERYEKLGSPHLGFIPDWGATMRALPRTQLRAFRERGATEELLAEFEQLWNGMLAAGPVMIDRTIPDEHAKFIALAEKHGRPDLGHDFTVNNGLFGRGRWEEWAEIMPWAVHTHGKFYEINDEGFDPSVPIEEIIGLYVESGYSNVISSEWEGFHFNMHDDAFDVIDRQQALLRSAAEKAGSRIITKR